MYIGLWKVKLVTIQWLITWSTCNFRWRGKWVEESCSVSGSSCCSISFMVDCCHSDFPSAFWDWCFDIATWPHEVGLEQKKHNVSVWCQLDVTIGQIYLKLEHINSNHLPAATETSCSYDVIDTFLSEIRIIPTTPVFLGKTFISKNIQKNKRKQF